MTTSNGHSTDMPSLDETIEQVGEITDTGTIPSVIHNNQEVHDAELERIFGRSWVFVGHESEIPTAGDYAKRYIGDSPFIFVRDENEEIQVLFDSCQHRGTTVVRAEQGNATHFRCPYHNWTYKNTGELIGVPHKEQFFQELDMCEHSLESAARVDTYEGLVFASMSHSAPSLAEYLGDFTWYLDLNLNFVEGGMEVVGEPIRWEIDTNWKIGADNFTGDSYHTLATHKSAMDLDIFPPELSAAGANRSPADITDCSGHSCMLSYLEDREHTGGYPPEVFSAERLTDEQFSLAKRMVSIVGTVFPNLSFLQMNLNADPENRELTAFLNLRKWQPVGPETTQLWNWILVPRGASDAFKERAYDTAIATFSVSGSFEVDDFAVWDGIAEAAGSTFAHKHEKQSNFQMGLGEMGDSADISKDWPGPGTVYETNFEDGTMQTFYQSWYRAMTGVDIGGREEGGE